MNRFLLLFFGIFLFTGKLFAQNYEVQNEQLINRQSVRLGIGELGYGREWVLGNQSTLLVTGSMYVLPFFISDYEVYDENGKVETLTNDALYWSPTLAVQPRYYYNFQKRVNNGSKTRNNAANFLSVDCRAVGPSYLRLNDEVHGPGMQLSVVPQWGMRRNVYKNITFEWMIGYGAFYQVDTGDLSRSARLDLAFEWNW